MLTLLFYLVNGSPAPLQADEVKHIRTELQKIRNQVNQLIDQLEPRPAMSGTRVENEKSMILNLIIYWFFENNLIN